MKKMILAAAILFAACSTKTNDVSQAENCAADSAFVASNVPAEGVDVSQWSGGIQHIGLPTAEVQKTIDFYRGLGFTLATRHDINGRDFAFVQLGSLLIEIIVNRTFADIVGVAPNGYTTEQEKSNLVHVHVGYVQIRYPEILQFPVSEILSDIPITVKRPLSIEHVTVP